MKITYPDNAPPKLTPFYEVPVGVPFAYRHTGTESESWSAPCMKIAASNGDIQSTSGNELRFVNLETGMCWANDLDRATYQVHVLDCELTINEVI